MKRRNYVHEEVTKWKEKKRRGKKVPFDPQATP